MAIKLLGLNHYSIAVIDLEKSLSFYQGVLGMDLMPRPDFDFDGAWLDCGQGISLHLIVQDDIIINQSGSRQLHFAFEVSEILLARDTLIRQGIHIVKDIKPRPDGILQMFIQDPDGYYIEITELESSTDM